MLYLPGHDRFFDAVFLKERDHLSELADPDPGYFFGNFIDAFISLFLYCNDRKRRPGRTRTFDNKKWKLTVSGDESEFHLSDSRGTNSLRIKKFQYEIDRAEKRDHVYSATLRFVVSFLRRCSASE